MKMRAKLNSSIEAKSEGPKYLAKKIKNTIPISLLAIVGNV